MQEGIEIENKVAKSGLVTISLGDFYQKGERKVLDIKQFLWNGIVVKEKLYREEVQNFDWSQFENTHVAITCSEDTIIPSWAYLLVTVKLQEVAQTVILGSLDELEKQLFQNAIDDFDFKTLEDKRVLVKGCADVDVPDAAFVYFATKAITQVQSLMFGEACSNVPLYKKK